MIDSHIITSKAHVDDFITSHFGRLSHQTHYTSGAAAVTTSPAMPPAIRSACTGKLASTHAGACYQPKVCSRK